VQRNARSPFSDSFCESALVSLALFHWFGIECRDRPSGDAYVELETRDDLELAIMQNRKDMGNRFVSPPSFLFDGGRGMKSEMFENL
jgi:hypothetical protein